MNGALYCTNSRGYNWSLRCTHTEFQGNESLCRGTKT